MVSGCVGLCCRTPKYNHGATPNVRAGRWVPQILWRPEVGGKGQWKPPGRGPGRTEGAKRREGSSARCFQEQLHGAGSLEPRRKAEWLSQLPHPHPRGRPPSACDVVCSVPPRAAASPRAQKA